MVIWVRVFFHARLRIWLNLALRPCVMSSKKLRGGNLSRHTSTLVVYPL